MSEDYETVISAIDPLKKISVTRKFALKQYENTDFLVEGYVSAEATDEEILEEFKRLNYLIHLAFFQFADRFGDILSAPKEERVAIWKTINGYE
jgi:hypothetical protein